jgi:DNA-binding FrmR family transcriptional regulator/copper chaperone CopZ
MLSNRLKSAEGHLRGVQRMVEADAYCLDIIHQIQAVQKALEKFNSLVLERHLQTCVTTAIQGNDPDERRRVIREIMEVFDVDQGRLNLHGGQGKRGATMETVHYHVPAISCGHCVATIKRELDTIDGVFSVEADERTRDVSVTFEPPAAQQEIESLMEEIGYPVQR